MNIYSVENAVKFFTDDRYVTGIATEEKQP
jgi:hypothetical protein